MDFDDSELRLGKKGGQAVNPLFTFQERLRAIAAYFLLVYIEVRNT